MRIDNILIFLFTAIITVVVCETMHEYEVRAYKAEAQKTYCAEGNLYTLEMPAGEMQ